ncbi:hypothetical protein BJ875DRAFT_486427 [Amylocarpus encephaloides]|uniref:Luciferase domain-containing protein n=1 Tax=Amylocarpus encephaloides TaxID=45428 RepID=A0A9P8C300_9HELO|nr:hypothetical protein BJ875DRAFT_486427 [Amylocarpus encephaloides]
MECARTTAAATQVVVDDSDFQQEPLVTLTQQELFALSLRGKKLALTIAALFLTINFLKPTLTCCVLIAAVLFLLINNDYGNFLSLGPGGTPPTFLGYLKITFLRLFALSDPYTPAILAENIHPPTGYYQRASSWLPLRNGPRPTIAGIAPQRQLNQPGCGDMYRALRTSLTNLAVRHPDTFRIGQSCFEKKGLALFARDPINSTCRGEIVHVHHSDRSMHMNLHPDDAKIVLEKGWGERHPLARGGWMRQYVPREFIMVYAPRDRSELDVICRIIEAAGFWVCGERFGIKIETESLTEQEAI